MLEWIRIRTDSQLIANQVSEGFTAKETRMARCLAKVKELIVRFQGVQIDQAGREENKTVNALSKLASSSDVIGQII